MVWYVAQPFMFFVCLRMCERTCMCVWTHGCVCMGVVVCMPVDVRLRIYVYVEGLMRWQLCMRVCMWPCMFVGRCVWVCG